MKAAKQGLKHKVTAAVIAAAMTVTSIPFAGGNMPGIYAAEGPVTFASSKNYGGIQTDAFKAIELTDDGGYVVAGYSLGKSEETGWDHVASETSTATNDGIVVKYDEAFHVEWAKNYGIASNDTLFDCAVLKNGTIVTVGRAMHALPEDSGNKATISAWLLMIDPYDPEEYKELYLGGSKGDYFESVTATADGGFAVAGYSASADSAEWGDGKVSETTDGVVVKFDADGSIQFARTYNYGIDLGLEKPLRSRFFTITEDREGNLVAAGDLQTAKSLYNSQVVKIDGKTGDQIWGRRVGAEPLVAPEDGADNHTSCLVGATALADGSYVLVGTTKNDATTEEDWYSKGFLDGVILRYSADGKLMDSQVVGSIDRTSAKNGAVDFTGAMPAEDGGYYVYGSTNLEVFEKEGRAAGYTWKNKGQHDVLLMKYDQEGKLSWAETYGGENGDYINGMVVNAKGELVGAGETTGESRGNLTYSNLGLVDATIFTTGEYPAVSSYMETFDQEGTVWEDGVYEDSANGYGGLITVKVTVADGRIVSVEEVSQSETNSYYRKARAMYASIVDNQTADVDTVSGATMSSLGIKRASARALSQAAARMVTGLIGQIGSTQRENAESARAKAVEARAAYQLLGSYGRSLVENYAVLTAAEDALKIEVPTDDAAAGADTVPADTEEPVYEEGKLSDTYYTLQDKVMSSVGWEAFRDKGITGEGAIIAVLDSGLTGSHRDLDYDLIMEGKDLIGGGAMTDTYGHGTAVTGIIQATADNGIGVAGILSKAKILPIRVGTGNNIAKAADLAEGIRFAVDNGASVITMSIGLKETAENLDQLEAAIKYAAEKNVLLIAAAGNSGSEESTDDPLLYPAAYDEVIGVGAINPDRTVRTSSQKNASVFVTAPGTNLVLLELSRKTKCKISSGTSYAAPIVAAVAGAAKAYDPAMTIDEFKQLLIDTVDDAGEEGYDTTFGHGILNMGAIADVFVPMTPLEIFVSRLYENFLLRTPDEKGLADWVSALESGNATGAQVVAGFVRSDEFKNQPLDDEAYVTALYRIIFAREPDEAGLAAWVSVLENGCTNKKVLSGFVNSDEFKALCEGLGIETGSYHSKEVADNHSKVAGFVARLYRVCLNRAYERNGLDEWVAALVDKRATGSSVAKGFFNSKEFTARNLGDEEFVAVAYRTLLDREPDEGGLADWLKALDKGCDRKSIVEGFLKSVEFGMLCESYGIKR